MRGATAILGSIRGSGTRPAMRSLVGVPRVSTNGTAQISGAISTVCGPFTSGARKTVLLPVTGGITGSARARQTAPLMASFGTTFGPGTWATAATTLNSAPATIT